MTDTIRLEFEPAADIEPGVVMYIRLPLRLASAEAMEEFIRLAYGGDCIASCGNPAGWLKITKPEEEPTAVTDERREGR